MRYYLPMANERKTENLVREHLKNSDVLIVEEQQSDNQRIKKLLKQASKSGNGAGYPEFICQFKENPDLLIVVECKPDIRKHESKTRDNPKDFAVDGALLYSSYLSKEYDVIAIGVSGETASELKVSHFLQLKSEPVAVEKFGDKLLSAENYLEGYEKSPEKFRQDYHRLLTFSLELNKKLHGYKIVESDRSLLISCVLIALENKAFAKSYKDYGKAEDLARFLVDTTLMEFKNALIQEDKLSILKNRYGFINADSSLSTVDGVLQEIITDIDDNINKFIKSHEYYDVLGQLYIEFLRYANSDKGLGIVLTPPHITEFMARVGEVNKDSVVYDNCTGTGGFLVSAMSLMIADAKDDQEKIKEIKKNQLVGVEFQAHIFALACSNMFIHQDGKTNILKGDCFDEEIVMKVKAQHPTVGLLNPPYKSDKKKDTEELEFVLNNLECLEQGGKCVAIVPMQTALAQSGKVYELKKKLLKRHTLEAVFSMPDELFFNSKVGVVSCIMVFTAKRPHPPGKSTFFGYYKDDGFVKRKNKGRIDLYDKFKDIQKTWVSAFQNKDEIAGLSFNQAITAEDEWCAEAYMETDYQSLSQNDFLHAIKDFVYFNELNNNDTEES
jgi:type I restriction enzyme M protein